jgi:methyl-accepting chemotaxis protein
VTTRLGAAAVAIALVLAAGCGGDDDDATKQWANDVCTELDTWVTSIRGDVQEVTDKGLGVQKADVEAAVADAEKATNDLVSGLNGLSPPEDSAVQQAKGEFDQLAAEIQQQLDNVKQAAASNTSALQLAQTVAAAVSASAATAKSTFETIDSLDVDQDLKDAFQDADSCTQLRDTIEELG